MMTLRRLAQTAASLLLLFFSQAAFAAVPDVTTALTNLVQSLGPIQRLVTGAAYVIGISLAFKALYHLKVYGELRTMMASNTSLKEPVTYLVVAVFFIYLPTGIDVVQQTIFGTTTILDYADINATSNARYGQALIAILAIVRLVGLIAFIRGFMILTRAATQHAQVTYGKALTHIIGGLLAINIVATAKIVTYTLGFT